MDFITEPWPWYIGGALIGLMVPIAVLYGTEPLGISSSFRHVCAACFPGNIDFFKYDWKEKVWNLFFVGGIAIGGLIASQFMGVADVVAISEGAKSQLSELGITNFEGMMPKEIFNFENLTSPLGILFMVVGGFLVGFGTRYAGGCTSGHTISGLSNLQWVSLVATVGFFAGGLLMTHLIFPFIF